MTDLRSSSALFKRAEQLKRWEESDTNKQPPIPKRPSRIQFSPGVVFLAASTAGDKEEVQRLLKMGADINTANVDGLTALHQACIDDNLDMVEFLVENGADLNCGDNEGWTPLHATASCGFLSIARYLLENGADVAAVNSDGELPVDIAKSDRMEEILRKALDETGVDCEKSRNAEMNILIEHAKNWALNGYVDVRDSKTGGSPLHVAAAKGYVEVAKILLEECHVEPDSQDYEGWTPLHAAALWAQKDVAALLLKAGADPHFKTYSGQTCIDIADSSIITWLNEAAVKTPKRVNINNNNNNKRKLSPPRHDVKRVELQILGNTDTNINDTQTTTPEVISESKPPKGRAPYPDASEKGSSENTAMDDEAPAWRRSASFRSRHQDNNRENNPVNNNTDNDVILRRTHSFENDKDFYQRYRDVTARIKASSCPSIQPLPQSTLAAIELRKKNQEATNNSTENTNEDVQTRISPSEKREREANTWSAPSTSANSTTTTTTTQSTAKRINPTERKEREVNTWNTSPTANTNANTVTPQNTVRSSSESVESNSSNSTPSSATPTKLSPGNIFKNFFKSFVPPVRDEESETQRKAHAKRARETRRSTQGVTLDEIKSAEELVKKKANNGTAETPPSPSSSKKESKPESGNVERRARGNPAGGEIAVTVALACASATATATIAANSERRPSWRLRLDPTNKFELEDADRSTPRTVAPATETTVTLPLRRPPAASSANTTSNTNSSSNEENRIGEEEKERESSSESKSSNNASPSSTQAALNVIQRRRRPKRRSTGVGHVDMDDIVNDRGRGGEGDGDTDNVQSGSERTEDGDDRDYKALYEASQVEVRRLRSLLTTSEQQLRDARATITRLTQVNQNSLSEIEKREKRAMERKLSEMEEELKQLQKLKAENERLRAENRALTRVVSKLTNSAAK